MAQADPPGRVARVNHAQGPVVFSPAGDDEWTDAALNRPLTRGDRLWTDRGSRAEIQVGSSAVRMDGKTHLEIRALDDQSGQLSVTQGTVYVRVRSLPEGEVFEIDTPNLAYRAAYPGDYRIDVDPALGTTRVTIHSGTGAVYGENGEALPLGGGQQITFRARSLAQVNAQESPPQDAFDRWAAERNRLEDQSVSARFVPREVVGYQHLDAHGQWSHDTTHGIVWIPQGTPADWAPYRHGHWEWISPWGWTWIDDAPWGFAPFHYGRWAMVGSRWAWVPGRIGLRPIYAPALVAFVGGSSGGVTWSIPIGAGGAGVAWFPLAPNEAWQPGYRASPVYISSVNRNIAVQANAGYAHQRRPEALTAISAEDFHRGRPVGAGWLRVAANILTNAQIVPPPPMPERSGVLAHQRATPSRVAPPASAEIRQVIAKPAPASAAEAIARAQREREAVQREAAQRQAQVQAQQQADAQRARLAAEQEITRREQAQRTQQVKREEQAARARQAKAARRADPAEPAKEAAGAPAPQVPSAATAAAAAAAATAAIEQAKRAEQAQAKEQAKREQAAIRAEQAKREQLAKSAQQAKRERIAALAEQAKREQTASRAEQAKREQLAKNAQQAKREQTAALAEQAKREQTALRAEQAKREQQAKSAQQAKREQIASRAGQVKREQVARRAEQAKREQTAQRAEQAKQEQQARREQAKREQVARRAEQSRREEHARRADQARRDAQARIDEQQRREAHAQRVEQARRAAEREAQVLGEQRAQREEQAQRDAQARERAQREAWQREQQATTEQWRRDHQQWEQQQREQRVRQRPDLRDDRRQPAPEVWQRGIPILNPGRTS